MQHLDFVERLNKFGFTIFSTNKIGKVREFKIPKLFNFEYIIANGFKLSWKNNTKCTVSPIVYLLKSAIDIDEWKHSRHIEISPENYPEIESIIQDKIIQRAEEIDNLLAIYFQLHHEMAENKSARI